MKGALSGGRTPWSAAGPFGRSPGGLRRPGARPSARTSVPSEIIFPIPSISVGNYVGLTQEMRIQFTVVGIGTREEAISSDH